MDDIEFSNTRDYVQKLKSWLDAKGYDRFFWRDLPEQFKNKKWFKKATWRGFIRHDRSYRDKRKQHLRRWIVVY